MIRIGLVACTALYLVAAVEAAAMGRGVDSAQTTELLWSHDATGTCVAVYAPSAIACGEHGTFFFGEEVEHSSCAEAGPRYTEKFYSRPAGVASSGPGIEGISASSEFAGAGQTSVAILDYFETSHHGEWVSQLIEDLAPDARIEHHALDSAPLRGILGDDVTDAHLLAGLCRLRNAVERGDRERKPDFLNLSVARHAFEDDPSDSTACGRGLRCHVSELLRWFNDDDPSYGRTVIVTAAGNHRLATFPAILNSTVAAGAVDVTALEARSEVAPLRESGAVYDALLPAQNLCSNGVAMPFGTSFSAAFLTGAFASSSLQIPVPTESRIALDRLDGCLRLTAGGAPIGQCLPGVDALLGGILGGDGAPGRSCLSQDAPTPTRLATRPSPNPGLPNLQVYNTSGYRPTPSGNYCVPCSGAPSDGGGFNLGLYIGDLTVGTAETPPIREGFIDSMYYRYFDGVADVYYEIEASDDFFRDFESGAVEAMTLEGVEVPLDSQPAIEFVIKSSIDGDCPNDSDACPRTSIPIQL